MAMGRSACQRSRVFAPSAVTQSHSVEPGVAEQPPDGADRGASLVHAAIRDQGPDDQLRRGAGVFATNVAQQLAQLRGQRFRAALVLAGARKQSLQAALLEGVE